MLTRKLKQEKIIMRLTVRFFTTLGLVVSLISSEAVPMQRSFLLPGAVQQASQKATANPTRRALLIGINIYQPEQKTTNDLSGTVKKGRSKPQRPLASKGVTGGREAFNLKGPRNDVKEMRAVIEKKYGFTEIKTLEDQQATRDAILKAIDDLIARSSKGDIAFFYYAGHGSRVRNSKNGEAKGYDESIVPADLNLGARDIRDKELARRFLKAINKGVVLTAVFDSCHSGSIVRGGKPEEQSRSLPYDEKDVAEEPGFVDPPEKQGAVVFSAAQDYEETWERYYNGVRRGNFSWAFTEVLNRDTTLKDELAATIFQKVVALMSSKGIREQPVFACTEKRRQSTLFDAEPSSASVPTATVSGIDGNEFVLQGGLALGLGIGSELKKKSTGEAAKPIRLRVTKLFGLSTVGLRP